MTNEQILSELFHYQNPIFINLVFQKNIEKLTNLAHYIKNKNLIHIPFEKADFQSVVFECIKIMKNINSDVLNKYNYYTILKKIFIQHIISINRKYLNNKQKVLSIANVDIDKIMYQHSVDYLESSFHKNYDLKKIYKEIANNFSKSSESLILDLYLDNVKPNKIAKITNQSIKKVYNTIYKIKSICDKYSW